MSKKYTVIAHTESIETDSIYEARSIMESMAIHYRYASIVENETQKVVEFLEV